VIGTTHFTNAVIERRALQRVGALRIGLPASASLRPFIDWPDDPAGLVVVTDNLPRGNALLASRWGQALQAAMWASFLSLSTDHADERKSAPLGISASQGYLHLRSGAPLKAMPAIKEARP